jgi:hypothetical protein
MGKSRVQVPREAEGTCDSTTYEPIDLKVGDLRRLAWTPSESTVASRK